MEVQWNTINMVTNGSNLRVTVLTTVFYKKVSGHFSRAAKKSARNNEVTILPGWLKGEVPQ